VTLPTEKDVEKALHYVASTDETHAKEIAHVKALEHQVKTIKALAYLDADGTVGERTATADSSQVYQAWINTYENAIATSETTKAKRKRAELTIDVWRSINANRRIANV
jgi:flagellar biosynthesis chaperone FliJ|tara:strand:- start:1454 stop:1780 length:327 start_codon:yes stop_codon:yes gene_type:complete